MIFVGMIIMGMLFIFLKTVNMLLAKEVGVYKSNISNHLTGVITSLLILIILGKSFDFSLISIQRIGIYPMLGGFVGAFFVAMSNYTMPRVKVVISTVLILLGQSIAAIMIDFVYTGKIISVTQLLGTLLVLSSIVLYNYEEKVEEVWTK